MPCLHPIHAFRTVSGAVTFRANDPDVLSSVIVTCKKCRWCLLDLSRQWMVRAAHEASLHMRSCFVTLTYSDENLPPLDSVCRRDPQLFRKRFLKRTGLARMLGCAEYGTVTLRPHYHLGIFGYWPADAVAVGRSKSGFLQYTSQELSALWGLGDVFFGEFTQQTAAYIAQYTSVKFSDQLGQLLTPVTCPRTGEMGTRVKPFLIFPTRPGLGIPWLERHFRDVYNYDEIVLPDFSNTGRVEAYDDWLRVHHPDWFESTKEARAVAAAASVRDDSPERLLVKGVILDSKVGARTREAV